MYNMNIVIYQAEQEINEVDILARVAECPGNAFGGVTGQRPPTSRGVSYFTHLYKWTPGAVIFFVNQPSPSLMF